MNLQKEKIVLSYFESVKKRDYFEDNAEVHVEELTIEELEESKNDDLWLFSKILNECRRLAESVNGLARYEITLFYKIFDNEEEDFIVEDEKTFIFYVKNGVVSDVENIDEIKQELEEKAQENFCKAHNINYDFAKQQPCTLDYIEEAAHKQGILFASVEINKYYYNFIDSLFNQMYDKFIEELQSTY